MAINQSVALSELIAYVNEIRNDRDVMEFINVVKDVPDVQRTSNLVPAKPMLSLLGQVLTVEADAYHPAFPAACSKLSIETLQSVVRRADGISMQRGAAVMTNLGGSLMLNPVALAVLAREGIDVLIVHDFQECLDDQVNYTPSAYFVTEHFVL
ncbi:TPA: hypothetical protein QDB04_002828 [Burkholderia vietnamiensis]|nr:hypothetical protein [Burkholderia vietnamiensis]